MHNQGRAPSQGINNPGGLSQPGGAPLAVPLPLWPLPDPGGEGVFTFLLSLWWGGQAGDSEWPNNRCRTGAQAALPRTSEAPPDRRARP